MSSDLISALRVAQLDASSLDESIIQQLLDKLKSAFKYPIFTVDLLRYGTQMKVALYAFIVYHTVYKSYGTIGQKLMGVRLFERATQQDPSKRRIALLSAALVLNFWLKTTEKSLQTSSFPDWLEKLLKYWNFVATPITLVHFLWFLYSGDSHSVLHRIFGVKIYYNSRQPSLREVDTTLLRRDLLWQGFSELAVFYLSFINFHKLTRKLRSIATISKDDGELENGSGNLTNCSFCEETARLPYTGECGKHVYCYYCVICNAMSRSILCDFARYSWQRFLHGNDYQT